MVDKAVGVLMAIVFLAALGVIVSKRAQTAGVLTSFFKGFSGLVKVAVSPVTGK